MDSDKYQSYMSEKQKRYEDICLRCGKCCGADTAGQCRNLIKQDDGKFYCSNYEHRLGQQLTIDNKTFTCIPIDLLVKHGTAPEGCAYTMVSIL